MKAAWPCLLLVAACDVSQANFLNAVPVEQAPSDGPVHVYLGIDGLSRVAFDRARAQGAFAGMNAADLVGFFPAVSDYSWTRLLRAGSMDGYEVEYFNPGTNQLHNQGLTGVLEHPLSGGALHPLAAYRLFDFLGDGDLWTLHGYSDPEAALPSTLDAMFDLLATRGRQQNVLLAYLMNVDVVSHRGGLDRAVAMLVEIDRRIGEFKQRHPGRFVFTFFGDHGNAHVTADLVDPRQILSDVGITPVDALSSDPALHAVAIVHVRVNFVTIHCHPEQAPAIAERTSRHPWVDLAVAPTSATSYGVWKAGKRMNFTHETGGDFVIEDPSAWRDLGIDLTGARAEATGGVRLSHREAFTLTAGAPYPDIFHRVASAFENPTAKFPANVLLSMPDNVTSFGFHIPGSGDTLAVDGFHGALTRGSTLSVVASEVHEFPGAVRSDDLLDLLPPLAEALRSRRAP